MRGRRRWSSSMVCSATRRTPGGGCPTPPTPIRVGRTRTCCRRRARCVGPVTATRQFRDSDSGPGGMAAVTGSQAEEPMDDADQHHEPATAGDRGHHRQVVVGGWLTVVAGLFLMAAPFLFGYRVVGQAVANDLLAGAALAVAGAVGLRRAPRGRSPPSRRSSVSGCWWRRPCSATAAAPSSRSAFAALLPTPLDGAPLLAPSIRHCRCNSATTTDHRTKA